MGVVVVIILPEVPGVCVAVQGQGRLFVFGLFTSFAKTVWLIMYRAAEISINAHGAIPVKAVIGALRRVDWNLIVVDAEAVALRVSIREESSLKPLIGRDRFPGRCLPD